MSTPTDASDRKIRLLIVDDNEPSRIVQSYVIEDRFPDVSVTSCEQPPPIDDMLGYDGIILDERLIRDSGLEIARSIHERNWRLPLMIMTSLRTDDPTFEDAHAVVDYVATKSDPMTFIKVVRAFLRQIRRIQAASPRA